MGKAEEIKGNMFFLSSTHHNKGHGDIKVESPGYVV